MQSLGGNYMSTHCNVEAIIKEILQYADKDLILYFCYIMVFGIGMSECGQHQLIASEFPRIFGSKQQPINQ